MGLYTAKKRKRVWNLINNHNDLGPTIMKTVRNQVWGRKLLNIIVVIWTYQVVKTKASSGEFYLPSSFYED